MQNSDNIKEIREMNYELESSDASFISELMKIKRSSQSAETKLALLDLLVKDFLNKKFHLKKNSEYSELVEFFLQKNKPPIALFCHQMTKQLYGGELLNRDVMDTLIDEAREMIDKETEDDNKKDVKKGLLSSLFKSNKKNEVTEAVSSNVSKQTEKIINKKLMPEGLIKVENLKNDNPGRNIEQFEQSLEKDNSINAENMELIKDNVELEGSESIKSIDDLDRIKEKIRYRKLEVAKEKAENSLNDYN